MTRVTKTDMVKALATGDTLLGCIVMWTLRDAYITRVELEGLFSKHGLDWDRYGPKEITPADIFRKAQIATKRDPISDGYLFRPIDNSSTHAMVGIVNEQRFRDQQDLKYSLELRIKFDKINGTVSTDDSSKAAEDQHPVGRSFKQHFKALAEYYTPNDFVKMLCRNSHKYMGGLVLRGTGGVYFVPAHMKDDLDKLKAVVDEIGQSRYQVYPVYASSDTKADLGYGASLALQDELAKLKSQIDDYRENIPRRDTMRNRLDAFKALREKAAFYSNILTMTTTDLEDGIGDCEAMLKKLIGVETDRIEGKKKSKKADKRDDGLARVLRKVQEAEEAEELEDEPEPAKAKAAPKKRAKVASKTAPVKRVPVARRKVKQAGVKKSRVRK